MKKIIELLLVFVLAVNSFTVKAHDVFLKNNKQTFALKTNDYAKAVLINPVDKGKGEMIIGEKIDYIISFWKLKFTQNGRKLKIRKMVKTLQTIDVCKESMKQFHKYITLSKIFNILGILLFLPLMGFGIYYGSKGNNYLKKAIDDYNKSLK